MIQYTAAFFDRFIAKTYPQYAAEFLYQEHILPKLELHIHLYILYLNIFLNALIQHQQETNSHLNFGS